MDICEWAAPALMISWVEEELKKLPRAAETSPGPGPQQDSVTMCLGVLAFAYARNVFDSEEIAQLCHSDPLFRALSKGLPLSSEALNAVRKKDRGLLVKLVTQLLLRATLQKLGRTPDELSPALKRRLHENASDRLDTARNIMNQG